VRRVPTASRRLLVFALAVAGLALPSSAASEPSYSIIHTIRGTVGANGWYTSNVTVNWTFDPPPDQTQGCDARTITAEGSTQVDCQAWWGTSHFIDNFPIKIDKTAPAVHGVPSRPPDASGWYNKPVTIAFTGTDATSRLAGCSSTAYSGPDNGNASVAGTCTDNAGNVGRATYGFPYDSTPPTLGTVTVKHGNRNVLLKWTASPDTHVVQVTRTRGSSGPSKNVFTGAGNKVRDKGLRPGAKYKYTVTAFDPAANAAAKGLVVTGTGPLVNPVPGKRVTSPPRLVWTPVKRASYYNVQLIHDGTILSAWPTRANLQLKRSWIYKGRRHRLRPGVYRWYVWPGFGLLAQAHYGRRLGGSSFVVAR
jgi:hypothetical protein